MQEKTGQGSRVKGQGGFTLIELAIVLVIIGIIIGAVLKGQDLIENARHKKFANTIKQFEMLTWGFMDRKGYFPGDSDKDGLISGNPATDIGNGRFLDPPSDNSFALGSFTFYVFFGNDGTRNILTICKSADCAVFEDTELAYVEAFDTSIDGSADAMNGRVKGTDTAPTITSANWLATYASAPANAAYSTTTKAVLYYFDRK